MAYVLMGGFRIAPPGAQAAAQAANAAADALQYSNTRELGKLLYTEYIYPVQIAAVILVVAMVSAIALTLRHRKDTKFVDASAQVHVKARDRLRVVKLAPTRAAPPPPPVEVAAMAAPADAGKKS